MEEETKIQQVVVDKKYTINDLKDIHQKDSFSAFGRMPLSVNVSEPEIGFGKSTRDKRAKVYQTKENMKAFLGIPFSSRKELSGHVYSH